MVPLYETVNTFTRRPVVAQFISYFVFFAQIITFFVCVYVNYKSTTTQIIILIFFIITLIIQLITVFQVSYIDPSDDTMIEYRNDAKARNSNHLNYSFYCQFCESYVKQTSRHCKVCKRCVQKFDHHCMWINNCIGDKNYNWFMAMIISTALNLIVYIIGIALLWQQDKFQQYFGKMIAIWVIGAIVVIFFILLLNLIGLHIYLIIKGLTTYQFIMMQRDADKKKQQQQKAKNQKNILNAQNQVIRVNSGLNQQNQNTQQHLNMNKMSKQLNFQSRKSKNNNIPPMNQNIFASDQNFNISKKSMTSKNPHQTIPNFQNLNNLNIDMNNNDQLQSQTQKSQKFSIQRQRKKSSIINENHQRTSKKYKSNLSRNIQTLQVNTVNLKKAPLKRQQLKYTTQVKKQSQQVDEINISKFFTRNKSLKFIIGDQIGVRPSQVYENQAQGNNYNQLNQNSRLKTSSNQKLSIEYLNNFKKDYKENKQIKKRKTKGQQTIKVQRSSIQRID